VGPLQSFAILCGILSYPSAETVNTFKNRLDKFWSGQEVLHDYKTDLHGIGNRSIVYIVFIVYIDEVV